MDVHQFYILVKEFADGLNNVFLKNIVISKISLAIVHKHDAFVQLILLHYKKVETVH